MRVRTTKQGNVVLADVRRWQRAVAGIASTVRMGQDPEAKIRKLRELLDRALDGATSSPPDPATLDAEAASALAPRAIADARVDARQRILLHLARVADRFLSLHVVLENDRRVARNELFEILFDASDLGAEIGVLRALRRAVDE
jgi:hypothetical protein